MNATISTALKGWVPYRIRQLDEGLGCEWLFTGDMNFDRPFFDETISVCKSLPENSKLRHGVSNLTMLDEWVKEIKFISPTAIIFHISRCGSTLLSQLLATDPANIVLSEVPIFDEILQMGFQSGEMNKVFSTFQSVIKFYGVKKNTINQHLFIKTDSWHIHFYKELREMFPDIPFMFIYRRPDEVIRSHKKQRGMHAVPGVIDPSIFGINLNSIDHLNFDVYLSKVLCTYYAAILEIIKKDTQAFAFDYEEGTLNLLQKIVTKCGIRLSGPQLLHMKERSTCHSKFPGQVFEEEPITNNPPHYLEDAFNLYNSLKTNSLTHQPTS
jgi:hypothetical protein